jgi:hypothetical protein
MILVDDYKFTVNFYNIIVVFDCELSQTLGNPNVILFSQDFLATRTRFCLRVRFLSRQDTQGRETLDVILKIFFTKTLRENPVIERLVYF